MLSGVFLRREERVLGRGRNRVVRSHRYLRESARFCGGSLGRSESGGLRRLVARASRESRETSSRSQVSACVVALHKFRGVGQESCKSTLERARVVSSCVARSSLCAWWLSMPLAFGMCASDGTHLEPYNKPGHVVRSREECPDANQPSSHSDHARAYCAVRGSQRKLTNP